MKNPTQKFPGLTAVYDFMVSGSSVDTFLKRKDVGNLTSFFNSDDQNKIRGQGNPNLSWVISEIHDWPRFLQSIPNDWFRSNLISAHLAMMQGMPLYY